MSTPQQQQQVPKGQRRSGRKNKNSQLPNGTHRPIMSDNEASLSQDQTSGTDQVVHKGRRKSHAHDKIHISGNMSDNPQPTKTQATPIKQAYAGPTFHQSPAASALPMPSMYSRSVPANAPMPIVEDPTESVEISPPGEGTPTKRESTPLDFLFDAARQARGGSPAARSGNLSIPSRSPAGKSPGPRDDAMFPFELDGGSTPGDEDPTFTSTYKERVASVRSTRNSDSVRSLEEHERQAKTDALKKLLMHQGPQNNTTTSDPNNPFNARPAQPRHRSGPNTPSNHPNHPGQVNHYFATMNESPNRHYVLNTVPPRPSSHLRYEAASEPEPAELSSDNALSPQRISTARRQANHTSPYHQQAYHHPVSPPPGIPPPGLQPRQVGMMHSNFGPQPPAQAIPAPPSHRSKPSAQQLEDDLRKVLNLNVASKG
jgi:hypothetical protein